MGWATSFYNLESALPLNNLIAKMHNTSKFWSIKFMDANFFYWSIYDMLGAEGVLELIAGLSETKVGNTWSSDVTE